MAQPTNVPNFVVLPAKVTAGMSIIIQQFTDVKLAAREAIKQTAINNTQYFVYQAVDYTDTVDNWPDAVVDTIVLPVVNP